MGCSQSKTRTKEWGGPQQRRRSPLKNPSERHGEPVVADAEIPPFSPDKELVTWYNAQLEEGRKIFCAPPAALDKSPLPGTPVGSSHTKKKRGFPENVGNDEALTLYQVSPLNHVIGQGYFSRVMLADMTVQSTTADALAKNGIEAHLHPRKDLSHGASLGSTKANLLDATHSASRRYLIACKEYALAGDSAFFIYNQLRKEVKRLTHLTFSPRLLKVLHMEAVYEDSSTTENDTGRRLKLFKGMASHFAGEGVAGGSKKHGFCKQGDRSSAGNSHKIPEKVRIYMEYAKYGTLRNMLLSEIPKKFGKTYMHELTVRAYLREVLIALAFLHENDVVHADLCAKNIYISDHITNVYTTCFPAYIADIPAGKFATVPAEWVRRVLALMDPACMQPQYCSGEVDKVHNDSVMTHLGWLPSVEASGMQNHGETEVSPAVPTTRVEEEQGHHFHTITSGHAVASAAAAAVAENNYRQNNADENEAEDDRCRWVDEGVRMYLQEHSYNDDDNIPLPSPLSSLEGGNVFMSPKLDGVTILRNGSFSRSPLLPSIPPLLLNQTVSGEYSQNTIKRIMSSMQNSSTSVCPQGDESLKQMNPDALAGNSGHHERHEGGLVKSPLARRSRKPLIKLGNYGRVRPILVGDSDKDVHKLGRVTHLAPENFQGASFTSASDIYAFAMTFIELTTPNDGLFADQRPTDMEPPRTRQGKSEYDAAWLANIKRYLFKNDNVVPLPPQLSEECKAMLRLCLQYDPARRPTAVELLQCKYFLLGHWVNVATKNGKIEAPWLDTNYEAAAEAAGLPRLPSETGIYDVGTLLRGRAGGKKKPAKRI
ncbi:putative Pseudokinase [Trypanosoma cruzi]|nr:putative Pseudokinase [Trypanosoma cruzi]